MASARKKEGLEICHVFADSIVFKYRLRFADGWGEWGVKNLSFFVDVINE